MQIPSYPVYRWFFIHCLCDGPGAAVLRPVASLCQCNCAQLVFRACGGGSQTLVFRKKKKKTVYSWLVPFRMLETCRDNICFTIYQGLLASQSQIAPALGFRWIFTIFRIRSRMISFLGKLGYVITYMKMGSTTISFLLLPDESRRIRFVTSIAGLFSPHLF